MSPHRTLNPSSSSSSSSTTTTINGFEENILAILDSSGVKQGPHLLDDRLSFLVAVRSSCLFPDSPSPPSWNMVNAIFQILRDSRSLELAMATYLLLIELAKRYPRVYLENPGELGGVTKLVVVDEAWSPFNVGMEVARREGDGGLRSLKEMIDPASFETLVEDITRSFNEINFQLVIKTVEDMLLFQYLVNVLEADFLPRQTLYKETLNWIIFRESILNMLLVSRKLKYKSVVDSCMLMISKQSHNCSRLQQLKNSVAQDCDFALAITVNELEKETCISAQKLLTLIFELDVVRKEADLNDLTSRVDGLRVPLLEIIVDELTYNKALLSPFLVVFTEPRWKLELILQYFSKYYSKPSGRTRRSATQLSVVTFESILGWFSTPESTKSFVKKIAPNVAQLLLAHAFQAYLTLQHNVNIFANISDKIGGITLSTACRSLVSAFKNIRETDKNLDVTSFEKEAQFTAEAILLQQT